MKEKKRKKEKNTHTYTEKEKEKKRVKETGTERLKDVKIQKRKKTDKYRWTQRG